MLLPVKDNIKQTADNVDHNYIELLIIVWYNSPL